MKILFIFTGGTISTTLDGNVMKVDKDKPYALIKAYENKYGMDFSYDCYSPFLELSENNTCEHLDKLCSCVMKYANQDYDGIIVTHGTDTLQYSACALSYTLGLNSIPVCLVSASFPLSDANSNAIYNLHSAILFIKNKLGKGVFVPFKNTKDSFIKVHRAPRLLPSAPFSDEVMSVKDQEYGRFFSGPNNELFFTKNPKYLEKQDEIPPFAPCFLQSHVLFLHAHVGMSYPTLSQNIKYVLISSYHSGTVDTKSKEAREFYTLAKTQGIKVFISGVENGNVYESATEFYTLNLTPLPLSPISAYIKLLLISSQKDTDKLYKSLGGDL